MRDVGIEDPHGNVLIDNVNIDIGQGEIALVSGGCGSGKSLILRSIAGIVQTLYPGLRIYGDIRVYGYRPVDALRMGYTFYVPQDIALAMTSSTLVDELEIYGVGIDRRIVEALGISDKVSRPINMLSAGERYRVMLALSLHLGKKVILIDEPSAYIDSTSIHRIIMDLRRYSRENSMTIVIADHRKELFQNNLDIYVELPSRTVCRAVEVELHSDMGVGNYIINVRNISFGYGNKTIINGLSMNITMGDVVAIVGPNGSGKTTLIKLLMGFLRPRSGRIRRLYRKAFYIPQLVSYWLMGRDITEVLDELGISKEVLIYSGIWGKRSNSPYSLSLGDVRRLGIYMGIYSDRDVVFIDEISLGLDYRSIECVRDVLSSIRKKRLKAVVFSTHDRAIATYLNPTRTIDLGSGSD